MLKARIKFSKKGAMRYIGHLEVMRYFQKIMRRAQIPIAFTEGYSPHMIMSFASPLGVGAISQGEYFDIELAEPIASLEAMQRMNEVSVEGIEILSFRQIAEEKKQTGMTILAGADYLVRGKDTPIPTEWFPQIASFLAQPEIIIMKKTKRSEREVDIRPMIYDMHVQEDGIFMQLAAGSVQNLKPGLVMKAFCNYLEEEFSERAYEECRLEMYADRGEYERNLVSLETLGQEIVC